jgi:hypothetical protein
MKILSYPGVLTGKVSKCSISEKASQELGEVWFDNFVHLRYFSSAHYGRTYDETKNREMLLRVLSYVFFGPVHFWTKSGKHLPPRRRIRETGDLLGPKQL